MPNSGGMVGVIGVEGFWDRFGAFIGTKLQSGGYFGFGGTGDGTVSGTVWFER